MGGSGFFLIIIAFVFLYFVLVRPQKRRQLQQQKMLNDVKVGDEIVTAGGMYGEIREVHDDDVLVRIAPELDVRVARRAIAGIITPEPEELESPEEPEPTGPTPGT
jgi:preprotein translocase subunit YajC